MNTETSTQAVTFNEDTAITLFGHGATDELASMMNDLGEGIILAADVVDGADTYTISAETAATLKARIAARQLTWFSA